MAQEQQTTQCPQCGKSFPTTVRLCPDDGTVLEHKPVTATQIGTVLDGKYRLDAFLSQGGMGAVYRATHVMLNRQVAVKLINPELVTSPEIVRRFQREARAATVLNHPNIVSVYDLGQTANGTLYIAMEFVDGRSLKSEIEAAGPLPTMRALNITRQLTSALSLAHRHGVIHRDIKPHNVMLARSEDGQQVAKLVDFGIAKTFEEGTQLTVAGFTPGTPQYMSPEQAEGRVVDARSDLYSLGIVLYEMLTGQVPFNAPSLPSLLIKHIKEAPQPPSLKNPNVVIGPDLEAITLRCLAKNPDDRFQTADELGAALDRAAAASASAVASMQATLPVAGTQLSPSAWNAATIPATPMTPPTPAGAAATVAAPPSGPAPTVKAQQPVAPPAAATHPTVAPQPQPPAAIAPPSPSPNRTPLVLAGVLVVAAAAIVYTNYFKGRSTPSVATTPSAENRLASDAPTASPAMAPQASQPSPQPEAAQPSAASPAAQPLSSPPPPAPVASPGPSGATLTERPTPTPARADAPAAPARSAATGPTRGSAQTGNTGGGQAAVPTQATSPAAAAASRVATAAPTQAAAANDQPARPGAPAAFPEKPSVFFQCDGEAVLCGQLRPAVADALEKAGLSSVRNPARADIGVFAMVTITDERINQQFRNTFAVRNYSIEITAEAPRTDETVPMPPPTSVSFDAQYGAERAVEKSRLVASDIVDRVVAFARRKRGN